jgi:WD40 repeat protein
MTACTLVLAGCAMRVSPTAALPPATSIPAASPEPTATSLPAETPIPALSFATAESPPEGALAQLEEQSDQEPSPLSLNWLADGVSLVITYSGTPRTYVQWDVTGEEPLAIVDGKPLSMVDAYPVVGILSPDGSMIASGSVVGAIILHNTTDFAEERRLTGHTSDIVYSAAWSPDGSRLASAGFDNRIVIWDTATWEPVQAIEGQFTEHAPTFGPMGSNLSWSPDGSRIVLGTQSYSALIFDVETGQQVAALTQTGDGHTPMSVEFSPDGRFVAVDHQSAILLYDAATFELLRRLEGHATGSWDIAWLWDIAWSPDSKWLASASADGTVIVWQIQE